MAITKERKRELVAAYGDLLRQTDGLVVTEYTRLSTSEVDDLRARLRDVQGRYIITKNTLFKIALEQTGWPVPEDLLSGPVAVVFSVGGNLAEVAKTLLAYTKDHEEQLRVKGGAMPGELFTGKQITVISNLPSLDELRSQLLGLLAQPGTGIASVLSSATGQIVQVLHAYVQENGGDNAASLPVS